MTTDSEISEVVVSSLQPGLETGLASRGLVSLVEGGRLHLNLIQAQRSWGLIAADFCANLIYNRRYSGPGSVIDELLLSRRLHLFKSLGSFEQRKARISERDRDYVGALFWWVCARTSKREAREHEVYLVHLFRNIVENTQYETPRASLEALIERLWQTRAAGGYAVLLERLTRLQRALEVVLRERDRSDLVPLIFRLQNFMLAVSNHLGDQGWATSLIEQQQQIKSGMEGIPEYFGLILELELLSIEAAINGLNWPLANDLAQRYLAAAETYQAAWELIGQTDSVPVRKSRLVVKALMSLARCRILLADAIDHATLIAADQSLEYLASNLDHPDDLSRLHNYRIMIRLKQGRSRDALALLPGTFPEEPNPFDVFWTARTAGDMLLAGVPGAEANGRYVLAVAAIFGVEALLRERATEASVRAAAGGHQVLHLACHAEFDPLDALQSQLVLADGPLQVDEILDLDLEASLVTLSACSSGVSTVSAGDELVGMTRAWLYAGTSSVIATQWDVLDTLSERLMAGFYREWVQGGLSKARALQSAQVQVLEQRRRTAARRGGEAGTSGTEVSPFRWTPFVLVGDPL